MNKKPNWSNWYKGAKWGKLFKKGHFIWKKPNSQIKKLVPLLKKKKFRKILDLGCGSGRHMVYLGKKGFSMVGMDISSEALMVAQKWLEKEKIKNYVLIEHDMTELPFPNEHFDAVISINVIHHDKLKDIKETVNEIKRVLKKKGIAIINVASVENTKFGKGKRIEKNTYVQLRGKEKGIPHHFFTEKEAKKIFSCFKIKEFKHLIELNAHWFIVAEK